MADAREPSVEKISIYLAKRREGEPHISNRPPIAVTFYFKAPLRGDEGLKYVAAAYRGSWSKRDTPYKNRSICASCGPEGCRLKDYLTDPNNDPRWCFYFGEPDVESKDARRCVEIVNDQLTGDLAITYIRQIIDKVREKDRGVKVSDESGYFPEFPREETVPERIAREVRISLSEAGKPEAATG